MVKLYDKHTIKSYVRNYIRQRLKHVEDNPDVTKTDRLTLSTCYYHIENKLREAGFEFRKTTRQTIQVKYIRDVCNELNVTREDLGIIAA